MIVQFGESEMAKIEDSMLLGMAVGAALGSNIMEYGRRKAVFVAIGVSTVGSGITMWLNFYAIITGRLILGIGIGMFSVISPRFIEETIPSKHFDSLYPLFILFR